MRKLKRDIKPDREFTVDEFNPDFIYAFRSGEDVYKLHIIPWSSDGVAFPGKCMYVFVNLNNSACYSHSIGTVKEQVKGCPAEADIYEFKSFEEFVEWMYDGI